jgi:hypothetical protein
MLEDKTRDRIVETKKLKSCGSSELFYTLLRSFFIFSIRNNIKFLTISIFRNYYELLMNIFEFRWIFLYFSEFLSWIQNWIFAYCCVFEIFMNVMESFYSFLNLFRIFSEFFTIYLYTIVNNNGGWVYSEVFWVYIDKNQ